jgi:hypothetical protein
MQFAQTVPETCLPEPHVWHRVAPMPLTLPSGQFTQADLPILEYFPGRHWPVQFEFTAPANPYLPALQPPVHAEELAPADPNRPAAHCPAHLLSIERPLPYLPAGHGVHWPSPKPNFPLVHGSHSEVAGWLPPLVAAGHPVPAVHLCLHIPSWLCIPGGHFEEHATAAVALCLPLGHAAQRLAPGWLYLPPAQAPVHLALNELRSP